MSIDRSIPRDTLERMVQVVEPGWTLREAVPSNRGHTSVYHVEIGTPDGRREGVLKASPDDEAHGIATEARLLAILGERTGIPVPTPIGAVDDHEDLPAPFFLMQAMPGSATSYAETRHLDDAILRRLGRQTGAYLGELHSIDAVGSFGVVGHERAAPTDGGRPAADVGQLGVMEPFDTWSGFLRASVEPELEKLTESRFADLAPRLEAAVFDRIDRLGDFGGPVLGRIDHGIHNLLIDSESGEIRTLIDWGFTLAVTPGYDLATVEYVLSGAVLAPLDDASDRRALVRDAMASGYRETADYPADELGRARDCYELLAVLRAMNHLEAGVAKVPEDGAETVAAGLRADAGRLLD